MLRKIILILLSFFLIEIAGLYFVSHLIGAAYTVLLLVIDVLIGLFLIWHQGFSVVRHVRKQLRVRHLPGEALLNGICLLFAGILLIVPGFLSDIASILLLLPYFRHRLIRKIKFWLKDWFNRNKFSFIAYRKG